METNHETEIKLQGDDVALVLRDDGKMEVHLPNKEDSEEPASDQAMLLAAIAAGIAETHPALKVLCDEMQDRLKAIRAARRRQQ